jgi:DNA-binding LacI/PurR family transcriptional regulator
MPRITIRDVAEEAQVSISSVSRILRGVDYSYGEETQQRVREVAQQLGYQPHAAARLLRQQQKTLIGLVVHLSVVPHVNQLVTAARNELYARNYEPVLLEPAQLAPGGREATFPSLDMLAGIISLDLEMEDEVPRFYRELAERTPLVALYPVSDPTIDSAYVDLERCIYMAAEHLVQQGHKHIAFVEYVGSPYASDYLKAHGWQQATQDFGLSRNVTIALDAADYPAPAPFATSGQRILEMATDIVEKLIAMDPNPTALICSSDEVALSVLGQLATRGWKLPQDLSVVGVDGIVFGAYSYPPLTTITMPYEEIARIGVDRLMWKIKAKNSVSPLRQLLEPSLLLRSSTCVPPTAEGQ